MPRFGKYEHWHTTEESYIDGFKTGFNWIHDYRPGGPYAHKVEKTRDGDWCAYVAYANACKTMWLTGFDAGLYSRQVINPMIPAGLKVVLE